jgi:hypothetical protein
MEVIRPEVVDMKYEVHLCEECIRALEDSYPYNIPNEDLEIVKVSIYQCDNTVSGGDRERLTEILNSRNPFFADANKYIAVHTRNGYYKQGNKQSLWGFTNNIEDATQFTNLDTLRTLCDKHLMTAYRIQDIPGMSRHVVEYTGRYSANYKCERSQQDG